ncbi:hypothetical protein [Olsenella phocaeensis]|uniref:hypothetical protein n=1 Tax=Olsenella phocaeensis TaxID=1852385 RepID=UPI00093087F3|nr:hypothetical protein [Olsenella phocaeensis]
MTITSETIRKAAQVARDNRLETSDAALEVAMMLGTDTSGGGYVADALADGLVRVADAMDAMMPLPVGADGEPIRPGDGVWDEDGTQGVVTSLTVCDGCVEAYVRYDDGIVQERPDRLAHEHPDSFERVVRDAFALGGWSEEMVGDGPGYSVEDLVARCEHLAGGAR